MTKSSNQTIHVKIDSIEISPLVDSLIQLMTSKSGGMNMRYLYPSDISKEALEVLLLTQPVITYQQADKYFCICGIRTLQALKTNLNREHEVPIVLLDASIISDESLSTYAKSDFYLKAFYNMYVRNSSHLAELYEVIGEDVISQLAPRHGSKGQFAKDAGFNRQSIFYSEKHKS